MLFVLSVQLKMIFAVSADAICNFVAVAKSNWPSNTPAPAEPLTREM